MADPCRLLQASKAEPCRKVDDRALTLHVNERGVVVWESATPASLFGFPPQVCLLPERGAVSFWNEGWGLLCGWGNFLGGKQAVFGCAGQADTA